MYLLISNDAYDNYSTNGEICEYSDEDFHSIMTTGCCSRGIYYTDLRREVLLGNYDIYIVTQEVSHAEILKKYTKQKD